MKVSCLRLYQPESPEGWLLLLPADDAGGRRSAVPGGRTPTRLGRGSRERAPSWIDVHGLLFRRTSSSAQEHLLRDAAGPSGGILASCEALPQRPWRTRAPTAVTHRRRADHHLSLICSGCKHMGIKRKLESLKEVILVIHTVSNKPHKHFTSTWSQMHGPHKGQKIIVN